MAVTMNSFWDNAGTVIPGGDAEYVVAEQPIAEYDNWFNSNVVADIQAVIDDVINKFNANTILKADTDNTPAALVVAEQTIVGRKTGNSIAALIDSEVLNIIGVEAGATADQTGAEIKSAYEAEANAYTDTKNTKLAGIETSADVTDSANVASSGAVMDSDFSAGEGFMRKTGAGTYVAIKSNMGAAVAPTVDEDSGDGYAIGSRWFDTTADKEYVCLDASVGAAVWIDTSSGGYDISSVSSKEVFSAFDSGTDVFHSHDEVATTGAGSYTKMKTITLGILPSSTLRIYFEHRSAGPAAQAWCRVYRNGGAVGTARMVQSGTYASYTENIAGWSQDDTLELYLYDVGGDDTAYCRNFRILGTSTGIRNS